MSASALAPHPVRIAPPDISRWRECVTGVPYVLVRDSGRAGPEVLVTALVHGNEYSGAIVLDELMRSGFVPARGRLTTAFCNVAAFDRFDAQRPDASRFVDEDFNRVWSPQRLQGPGDSIELRRARELLPFVERCTHLLDLHSMHEPGPALLVTGLLPRNVHFARRLGAAAQIVIDAGHADGARMRDHGGGGPLAHSRLALLLEAGQHWLPETVRRARDTLARFLMHSGAIDARETPAGWLLPDTAPADAVEVTHRVVARGMDFRFLGEFRGGEVIAAAGTPIAMDGSRPVLTPYDDCVLVMPSLRQLSPGVTTVRLGRRQLSAGG